MGIAAGREGSLERDGGGGGRVEARSCVGKKSIGDGREQEVG